MKRRYLDRAANTLLAIAGVWFPITKGIATFPPGNRWEHLAAVVWLVGNAIAVWAVLIASVLVLKYFSFRQSKRDRQRGVQRILDALVTVVMKTPENFSEHDFRASVYKFRRVSFAGWWANRTKQGVRPWSGWLVGIARSGLSTPSCGTIFRSHKIKQGIEQQCHGVCGRAWLIGKADVPRLPKLTRGSGARQINKYATRSFMSDDEVTQRLNTGKSLARSMYGERFGVGSNARWGVLIYDAIDPMPLIDKDNQSGNKLGVQSLSLFIEEFVR